LVGARLVRAGLERAGSCGAFLAEIVVCQGRDIASLISKDPFEVTTRNWNTIAAIAKVLRNDTKLEDSNGIADS
jgi:hypothetical protein